MLNLNTKTPSNNNNNQSNPSFKSLIAFKPRQVLLARHNPTTSSSITVPASNDVNSTKIQANLHQVLLDFFHRNGFGKTLKRFKSEAQIQTDVWKASSLRLEDMFSRHTACDAEINKSTSNKPVLENGEATRKEKACPVKEETTTKKKKKKVIVEIDVCAIKDFSEVADINIKQSSKNSIEVLKDIIVDELESQPKKKKTKHDLVSSTDDSTKKVKDKKKNNTEKVKLEPSTINGIELVTDMVQKEKKKKKKLSTDDDETIQLDVARKEKRSSKKRKRAFSDEPQIVNENVSSEMTTNEEFELQKTKTSKEEKRLKEEIDGVKSKKRQCNFTAELKGEY